jgi:hypothetical protein
MDICANVIVKHKSLLQDVLEIDKIHVDIFECIKRAMKNKKSCSNIYKKHFSTSYKLPYSILLASSPPSEMKWKWTWKCGIGNEECLGVFDVFEDVEEEVEEDISTCEPEPELEETLWEVELDQSS